ncbi:hypothetical protein CD133_11475 [Staphylococcus massiliensis CCUG 55927]|uniref:hypothetical protein n=1 Tax=Staphylococcus massiliensis TaxID=555791 RepID=UPI0002E68B1B|nr:hypothetical protein [Staphylococcus massiliensis]PNZ96795.1 hypothetical protein CD133_11475 [Staphylococcus massiliensis CCUG 55927]
MDDLYNIIMNINVGMVILLGINNFTNPIPVLKTVINIILCLVIVVLFVLFMIVSKKKNKQHQAERTQRTHRAS